MKEHVVTLLIQTYDEHNIAADLPGATLDVNGELYAGETGNLIGTWSLVSVVSKDNLPREEYLRMRGGVREIRCLSCDNWFNLQQLDKHTKCPGDPNPHITHPEDAT